jgi:phytoene dehydrogenase-like protein
MKEALTEKMLRGADRIVPGLSKHVTFRELGTPLTNGHYCMSTQGNLYGTAKSRFQVGPWAWPIRTEFEGLFNCGASTISHGVLGASQSGLFAAARALRVPAEELVATKGRPITLLPADDVSVWPLELQQRIQLKKGVTLPDAQSAL